MKSAIISSEPISCTCSLLSTFIVVENTGPYRKLLPCLKKHWDDDCVILTLDDDVIYHKDILKNYFEDSQKYDCSICYRGFTPVGEPEEFVYFTRRPTVERYRYNFATGIGGVIYRPSFFRASGDLIFSEDRLKYSKTNDDPWFNLVRSHNEIDLVVLPKQWQVRSFCPDGLCQNYNQIKGQPEICTKLYRDVYQYLKSLK